MTTFVVNLAPGWSFVDTGANGGGGTRTSALSALPARDDHNTSANGWNGTAGQFYVQGGSLDKVVRRTPLAPL